MANYKYLEALHVIREVVPEWTVEECDNHTTSNSIVRQQLEESYLGGELTLAEFSRSMISFAHGLLLTGFVLDAIDVVNSLSPEYVTKDLPNDLATKPALAAEMKLITAFLDNIVLYLPHIQQNAAHSYGQFTKEKAYA